MSKKLYLPFTDLRQKLPLFYMPWWLDITSGHWDVAVAQTGGQVAAVWPYSLDRKLGFRLLRNPPLTPYLGPLFLYPDALSEQDRPAFEAEAMASLLRQLPGWDALDIEAPVTFQRHDLLQHYGLETSLKVTYETDLQQTEQALWSALNSNHRNLIKQAAGAGTIDEGTRFLPDLLRLHEATFTRKGMRYVFSAAMIGQLVKKSAEMDAGCVLAAQDAQGHVSAAICTVWDADRAYLLLSTVDPALAHPGAVRMLIWRAMLDARARGCRFFDFEGSMDPGIAAFFRRFGGERKTYLCASRNKSVLWKMKKALLG